MLARLRRRPGWIATVDPYIGHGTPDRVHLRGRVVLRPARPRRRRGPTAALLTGLARYAGIDVPGEPVELDVAGRTVATVSDAEGYLEVDVAVPGAAPGWHEVTWRPASGPVPGRLLIVDPDARLGLVSDLDDTVIHTGLTRAWEAVRTTLLVADDDRVPIVGGAELYQALVDGDAGRGTGVLRVHRGVEPAPDAASCSSPATASRRVRSC